MLIDVGVIDKSNNLLLHHTTTLLIVFLVGSVKGRIMHGMGRGVNIYLSDLSTGVQLKALFKQFLHLI